MTDPSVSSAGCWVVAAAAASEIRDDAASELFCELEAPSWAPPAAVSELLVLRLRSRVALCLRIALLKLRHLF